MPPLPSAYQPSANAADDYLLYVKFEDAAEVRTISGTTQSLTGWNINNALNEAALEDAAFDQILTGTSCPGLAGLQSVAEQRSGRPTRDLAGIHRVEFSTAKTAEEMADLGNALAALAEVEFAQMVFRYPSPAQAGSGPGNFTGLQDYLGADPGGNFDCAAGKGLDGSGIRVTEMSLTYDELHLDLLAAPISMESTFPSIGFNALDQHANPDTVLGWLDHGSATLGMLFADHNSFGISGMTPGADGYLYPIWDTRENELQGNDRFEAAFCNALVDSVAEGLGNVVYIEAQSATFLPMEVDNSTLWELTRMGTDAGVVVLAAAGNGEHNLDDSAYSDWQDCGDSGAILVGAGSADQNHDRLTFSNYGERVHPHAWGEAVVTLGCGDLWGGDPNSDWVECELDGFEATENERYTALFGGTSSATPMVTAAAILLQEHTIEQGLTPLDSVDMRNLLTHTGLPQGTGITGHIGPFINVKEAIRSFDIADLAVHTTQIGNTPFTTFIANQGPRVAQDVEVEVVYRLFSSDTLTPVKVPSECEPLSYPEFCAGVCPATLECTFDRIEPGQPVAIAWNYCGDPALGGSSSLDVDAEAVINGELTDNNLSNNVHLAVVGQGTSCGILQ